MKTRRLTAAQALITFLQNQHVERDGRESPFFAGVWGIFGHGNVAGIGQALQQAPDFRYYLARNEQAMVHAAVAYAKMKNRLGAFACTSSVGPGATNMITGAATATINRLPVLLLPGDVFARRNVAPVLQQLESAHTQDASVNDAFRCVSRYWDRINRPDQLPSALTAAMRVLTSPAETGAVTLALPQDVQAEAWDYPAEMFEPRTWHVPRALADRASLARAAELIRAARKPLIIAGGGVIYSEASEALARLVEGTGIAICETMAGKGALSWDHPQNLEAIGATGTRGANLLAREADLVVAVGTRLTDFTTASKTAFQNEGVRFVNVNVAESDAHKHSALALVADARAALDELREALAGYRVSGEYAARVAAFKEEWLEETGRLFGGSQGEPITQGEVIGVVNNFSAPRDVVVCAAGSLPGDLHKLWRTRDPKGYHLEYGYSCMGYEIAGGLGVKMADPGREVYVMVGDGSYLMMSSEIVTSIQEGYKLTVVLLDNHGFASIGGLSQSLGSGGFGTEYRARSRETGQLDGARLKVDFAANAASLGAHVINAATGDDLRRALEEARAQERTTVIVVEVDREARVPGYESWWDVPVAEVSEIESVKCAREDYDEAVKRERHFL
ncbi:MAG: 3D-(3,5/4)-trihydroxycyclohexane-1,2-dione acylhydrolase (decyclizing) [Acidobacteria bacterium]|nr:3D-(3,5/4)-trihydroxycyclohexane-1,2-dione acylhydrolase (decyclizing) [Acidobacteriota bacterium]MCA1641656.1 3D-(3,5/4)-trihydroxycyclohexane-1,2-dione acylhydrolase (decyclizing) [Acidobacteriota bacterium]